MRALLVSSHPIDAFPVAHSNDFACIPTDCACNSSEATTAPKRKKVRKTIQKKATGNATSSQASSSKGATITKKGKKFCLAFNAGQCIDVQKCPKGFVHCCNFIEPDGSICGRPGCRRINHPHGF